METDCRIGTVTTVYPKWARIARMVAAALLTVAGAAHLEHPQLFLRDLLQYRLVGGQVAVWLASVIPFGELAIAVLLFSRIGNRWALGSAALLFGLFSAAQWSAWTRGLAIDCGCFGAYARNEIGPASLTLVSAMFAGCLLGSVFGNKRNRGCLVKEVQS